MPPIPSCRSLAFIALLSAGCVRAGGEDATTRTPPVPPGLPRLSLDLSRRDLVNFLTDEKVLAPYRMKNGEVSPLRDVFMLGSVKAPWAVIWDPHTCRLLGILDLASVAENSVSPTSPPFSQDQPELVDASPTDVPGPEVTPFVFRAEGNFPLAKTQGASDLPRYFGFRLVDGTPEFLYQCGRLSIEERIWLDDGGSVLRQRLALKPPPKSLVFSVPADWKGRVESSAGTWRGTELTVPQEQAGEVVLSYRLTGGENQPEPPRSN